MQLLARFCRAAPSRLSVSRNLQSSSSVRTVSTLSRSTILAACRKAAFVPARQRLSPRNFSAMSPLASSSPPSPPTETDKVLTDIADYVHDYKIDSQLAVSETHGR